MATDNEKEENKKSFADKYREMVRESPMTYTLIAGGIGLIIGLFAGSRK